MALKSAYQSLDDLPERIEGAAAWYGSDMSSSSEWVYDLTSRDVAEIKAAVKPIAASDRDIVAITKSEFPLPTLTEKVKDICRDVTQGRGFALMRGLPVSDWSMRETAIAYIGIGTHFGNLRSQNAKGHILGHVKDLGRDAVNDPTARIYQTTERQQYHCDRTDIVGLLCLKTAKSGGASSLVSSMTIYNEMMKRAPALVPLLFEPFPFDRRGEVAPGERGFTMSPIYSWHQGFLSAYYVPRYIESASRFDDAPRLTDRQRAALDLVDDIANEPGINFFMDFRPGDMQWVYNHTLLHDRTGFEDWPEDDRKRHLLRLWVSVPSDRPLPDHYRERWVDVEIGKRGGVQPTDGRLLAPLEAV